MVAQIDIAFEGKIFKAVLLVLVRKRNDTCCNAISSLLNACCIVFDLIYQRI